MAQLRCHTAKPGHIYNKFSWGNRKSLFDEPKARGVAVRDELVQYYRYCRPSLTLFIATLCLLPAVCKNTLPRYLHCETCLTFGCNRKPSALPTHMALLASLLVIDAYHRCMHHSMLHSDAQLDEQGNPPVPCEGLPAQSHSRDIWLPTAPCNCQQYMLQQKLRVTLAPSSRSAAVLAAE